MMRVLARISFYVLPFLSLIACPAGAHAQDLAAAEALFKKAAAELEAGNYDTACPAFAESQRLDPRPGTLYSLAFCRDKQGRIATALALYEDYLRAVDQMTTSLELRHHDRAKAARARKDSIAPDIPELTLELPKGAPADVKIVRDGVVFTSASLGIALPMDPGEHVVTVQVGEGPVREQRVTLQKREKKTLVLEIAPAAPPVPAPTVPPVQTAAPSAPPATNPSAPRPSAPKPAAPSVPASPAPSGGIGGQRIGAIAVAGLGLAGIGLGAAMGAVTLDKKAIVDARCPDTVCYTEEDLKVVHEARVTGTISTVGLGVGAASLAAAAVLWLTAPSAPSGPRKGSAPDDRKLTGILEVGPNGGTVGLKGAF